MLKGKTENSRTRKGIALLTAFLTMAVMSASTVGAFASEGSFEKEETVYVVTDAAGAPTDVIVSDHLVNDDEADKIHDKTNLTDIENVKQLVSAVRMVRNQKNIAPKEQLPLQAVGQNRYEAFNAVISKMANLSSIEVVAEKDTTASAFMIGTDEFAVPLGNMIDVEAEIQKMEAQLQHLEGFLQGVMKKLSNERFVANAPEAVVALERKKQSDSEEKIAALKESISALKGQKI